MKNIFDVLPASDQEEQFTTVDFKQKKNQKKQKNPTHKVSSTNQKNSITNKNQTAPTFVKQNTKEIRHDRDNKPNKDITDHRLHDRKSGTGRISQPRKNAGGAGGIGNIKDQLNQDKILSKVKQGTIDQQTEQKVIPKQPQVKLLTLEQYYVKQGISIEQINKKAEKSVLRKNPIEAEWLKKENLTVLKTKEDIQIEDQKRIVGVVKQSNHKIAPTTQNVQLGFKSNFTEIKKPREEKVYENKGNKGYKNQGIKTQKVAANTIFAEDDFPSL